MSVFGQIPGSLDLNFGNGGRVLTTIGPYAAANAAALQSDGKIVLAGTAVVNGSQVFAIVRYNPNGSLDATFDGDGIVTTSFNTGEFAVANAVATYSDGKILAVGFSCPTPECKFAAARYNINGSLDVTFGGDGKLTSDRIAGSSVVIQKDGKIVVAGWGIVGRLNHDGSLDKSFGDDGRSIANDGINAIAIQSDGKIVVAGSGFLSDSSSADVAVLRFNTDGSSDTSFGDTGRVLTDFGPDDRANSIVIQPNGKIVTAGSTYDGAGDSVQAVLARYNPDGSLDPSFDKDGVITSQQYSVDFAVALQADGKILATGYGGGGSSTDDFLTFRYNPDGSIDHSFNSYGVVSTHFGFGNDGARAVAVQPDGKIIVAGYGNIGNGYDHDAFAIARYVGEAVKRSPFDYDRDGRSDLSVWRPSDGTWYLALSNSGTMSVQPWGSPGDKIVPADYDGDGMTDMAVYRPNDDGSGLGRWYVINSSNFSFNTLQFGLEGDVPLPQDFDGDGRADLCVFRPADSTWYMVKSGNNLFYQYSFGIAGDNPVPADYSGDGKAEIAVWRPADGTWHTLDLTDGGYRTFNWGVTGDVPVPGDYSGDGRADYAVYRPANNTWYRMNSSDFFMYDTRWGVANDIPTRGDFDGDGKLDIAVFRPSEGTWYVLTTANQVIMTQQFGLNGDIPTESAFVYTPQPGGSF